MKKILIMTLLVLICLGLMGCSKSSNSEENKGNTYIVGFDNTFAPMGFEKDGENIGFDIDLAKKMEEKLDLKFEFQPIDWSLKESELISKNIDMIWNGYSVTDERKEKVLFSDAYMENRVLILVGKNKGIKSKNDLKGKIFATQAESSSLSALNKDEISNDLAEIITYASFNEVFSDLETGRADAIAIDETMGLYYLSKSGKGDKFDILEEDLASEEYAVGFRKEDTKLAEEFNKALKELKDEGEIDKIYEKWFK